MTAEYRNIPSVSSILECTEVRKLSDEFSISNVTKLVRETLDIARGKMSEGGPAPSIESLTVEILSVARTRWRNWPVRVINATGVVLHTNLGRSPLSSDALQAACEASAGYSDLELDLPSGKRGSRQSQVSQILCELTGAEDALVVNNNASAVLLGIASTAAGKDVVVSRSEAVEIGGGFRIPDVLIQSGAGLKEVGTTNRTYIQDFEKAIDENTGALLSVHASNFKIVGFTHAPTIKELSELGQNKGIPVLHDIGSGCLLDPSQFGLTGEPIPRDSIAEGADLCFFSGDKLLGGPQSGIIVGKKHYVSQLASHPLARAFRIDKMNLAALNATLLHYIREEAEEKIPIWRMLSATKHQLLERAQIITDRLGGLLTIEETRSAIGGGSFPGFDMESISLVFDNGSPDAMGAKMRNCETPVVCRIEDDRLIFDLRTVLSEEDDTLARTILQNVND